GSRYRVGLSESIRGATGSSLRWTSWSFVTGPQATEGTRFANGRDVRLAAGLVTGIRVDGRGRVIGRIRPTLKQEVWATASVRATINGGEYFLIDRGAMHGYWVSVASVTASRLTSLRADKPPSQRPVPKPDATAAPTPTPAPSADPVAGAPSPTAAPNQTASPTPPSASPAAPVVNIPTAGTGIIISAAEIRALPTSGAAWDSLKRTAAGSAGTPNLADMSQNNNTVVLAKALVYARTGVSSYRSEVIGALRSVMGTESGGETLALGRELAAYVLSADLIGLSSADPSLDASFRRWLAALLDRTMADGNSLTATHERRPNNWGTHAGASRAAVAAYLGDSAELARVATVFRGWLGDRTAYSGFSYGELWWQSNPSQPVGINPVGATIGGHNVDGVLPDDQRRTGEFAWPATCGNYPHGALDGAVLTAEILQRAGYSAYQWGNNALLRAEQWLQSTGCAPSGDNVWQLPLLDARYGTHFWNGAVVRPGKNFGWTDWLYGR
ncbi:MAG: alginate lyase family protein, partial [Candidatus Limnocylindria bacterium]